VKPGDRVAVLLPNREEHLPLFFGAAKAGAVIVPLNAWLKGEFLRYQMADCGASLLVTDGPGLSSAAPLLDLTEISGLVLLDGVEHDGPQSTTSWAEVATADPKPPAVEPATTIVDVRTDALLDACACSAKLFNGESGAIEPPVKLVSVASARPGTRVYVPYGIPQLSAPALRRIAMYVSGVTFTGGSSATVLMPLTARNGPRSAIIVPANALFAMT